MEVDDDDGHDHDDDDVCWVIWCVFESFLYLSCVFFTFLCVISCHFVSFWC